ncbi:MAG: oxaloacetate decarboxylase gamma subunit [Arenicella sp.]|jgi:oxaloacetate decarboxylase gamma subunit
MQTSLIDQGLDLMLYGMGTVFVFLTILVFATTLMSRIVNALANTELDPTELNPALNESAGDAPSPQILEAIKLALKAHRQGPPA